MLICFFAPLNERITIVLLGCAFSMLDDYRQQKRRGIKEPVFHRSQLPEVAVELDLLGVENYKMSSGSVIGVSVCSSSTNPSAFAEPASNCVSSVSKISIVGL